MSSEMVCNNNALLLRMKIRDKYQWPHLCLYKTAFHVFTVALLTLPLFPQFYSVPTILGFVATAHSLLQYLYWNFRWEVSSHCITEKRGNSYSRNLKHGVSTSTIRTRGCTLLFTGIGCQCGCCAKFRASLNVILCRCEHAHDDNVNPSNQVRTSTHTLAESCTITIERNARDCKV